MSLALFSNWSDRFFRRGAFSVTVPVMDGPLRPNQLLDQAPVLFRADALDNLTASGPRLFYSSGSELLAWTADGASSSVGIYDSPVSALAADGQGALAVGLDKGVVRILGGRHDGKAFGEGRLTCPTALHFADADTLIVANGSAERRASEWKRDLMSRGASGSVWRVNLAGGEMDRLADRLAFPCGLAAAPSDESLVVSCSWSHSAVSVAIRGGGRPRPMIEDLPAYPSRLVRAADGGYWLAMFAVRSQLVEFVLREKSYRERMMAEIATEFWVGPDLASGRSFLEPLQGGAVKQMGILKPWAPARSYGLVVRLDRAFNPVSSFHCRADGIVHGVTSLCEFEGAVIAGAKGPGMAVTLPLAAQGDRR